MLYKSDVPTPYLLVKAYQGTDMLTVYFNFDKAFQKQYHSMLSLLLFGRDTISTLNEIRSEFSNYFVVDPETLISKFLAPQDLITDMEEVDYIFLNEPLPEESVSGFIYKVTGKQLCVNEDKFWFQSDDYTMQTVTSYAIDYVDLMGRLFERV